MTKTISVSAQKRWVDTEVDLKAGDELIINASGQWTNGGQPAYYAGPEGFAGVKYPKATLNSENLIALIGKVGNQGKPFLVGGAYKGTRPETGRLYLQINDEDNDFAFTDNSGEMIVKVTSQSPERILSQGTKANGGVNLEGTGEGVDIDWKQEMREERKEYSTATAFTIGERGIAIRRYSECKIVASPPARLKAIGSKFDSVSLQELKTLQFDNTDTHRNLRSLLVMNADPRKGYLAGYSPTGS